MLLPSSRMIQISINEKDKCRIEDYKLPQSHCSGDEFLTLGESFRIEDIPLGTVRHDQRREFSHEVDRILDDIPGVEPEKSPDIHSEITDQNHKDHIQPSKASVIVDVPLSMNDLHRGISRNQSRKRHREDIYRIEIDHIGMLREMDEVCEDVETIREKCEPE